MPDVQIAGGGGLTNWRQSVEMIMYGATALTYCTVLYFRGFEVLADIEAGLRKFVAEQGYKHILDFRGAALKHIVTPDRVGYLPSLPEIDRDKCTGCGFCVRPSHCEVLELREDKAVVAHPEECTACSVCYWLCPHGAIQMRRAEGIAAQNKEW
jgi:dihydropyrimidine dehydrogenase (NAD+) subunit PreA